MEKAIKTWELCALFGSQEYINTNDFGIKIKGIQQIRCGQFNIPFENASTTSKMDSYLIPVASLINCSKGKKNKLRLEFISNNKVRDIIDVKLYLIDHYFEPKLNKGDENIIFSFAYQAISWNGNYKSACNVKKLKEYFNVGFDVIYDNRFHVKVNDTILNDALIYEINNLEKINKKIIIDDDLICKLASGTLDFNTYNFVPNFEYGKPINIEGHKFQFNNKEELEQFLHKRLEFYVKNPNIFGVNLIDEPSHTIITTSLKEIYLAIKNCLIKLGREDFYIYINLLPMSAWTRSLAGYLESKDRAVDYNRYLIDYVDNLGIDYISYDLYPLTDDNSDESQWPYIFQNLMIAAKVAKEKNVKLKVVTQTNTISFPKHNSENNWVIDYDDIKFLTNTLIGFGVRDISFFTYHYLDYHDENESWIDSESFMINKNGDKTNVYYSVKQILNELKEFAYFIEGYKYECSYIIGTSNLDFINNGIKENTNFQAPFEIKSNKPLLVSVLNKNNARCYMIQNINYSKYKDYIQKITIKSPRKYLNIFESGSYRCLKLENNKAEIILSKGRAIYIIDEE